MLKIQCPNTRLRAIRCAALCSVLLFVIHSAFAQAPIAAATGSVGSASTISTRPFSHFAIGLNGGTLGVGAELVTTISRRTNLRLDGDLFNYSTSLTQDGVTYSPNLRLRDYRASFDVYPFHGGFRLSAGMAAYNQFNVNAAASVPGGQTITLNDVDYYSSKADPLHGSASISYPHKYAGIVSFGWGNAIPRSGRHLAFPVEIGAALTGAPKSVLNLAGSACATSDPATCENVAAYSDFQTDLAGERKKIQNDINPFRVYPILDVGVTYRF
jgi:hypothetical protein